MAEKDIELEPTERKVGMATTFDENSPADIAYLVLTRKLWFKIFIIISSALALSEPFLVAWPNTIFVQKIVLAISTFLFFVGYITVVWTIKEGSIFSRFRSALLGEVLLEIVCLTIGWALIFEEPAMASLRCFRIFRFVWYIEFYRAKKDSFFYPVIRVFHLIIQYLEQLGSELFSYSSKGGVVVLGFFFYMAYILGVVYWLKTGSWGLISPEGTTSECDTLPHCFLIMLRLTFWDGDGLDFVLSLMDDGDKVLVAILVIYMCISALVLLNGLIGIFMQAFQMATSQPDQEDEQDEESGKELSPKEQVKKDIRDTLARLEDLSKQVEADIATLKN